MSKYFGMMMGENDALELLEHICSKIKFDNKQEVELFDRMKHRFEYLVDQAKPLKPKFHKGRNGKVFDYWTCRNCGREVEDGVGGNYCWNCGHKIAWDSIRCLTGNNNPEEKTRLGIWIPVEERVPENEDYILLSFENFSVAQVGRYEEDGQGGAFYVGDESETCISQDLIVNAWQPLPKPYEA